MKGSLWIQVAGGGGARAELPRQGVLSIGSSAERADFVVSGQGVADVHCAIGRAKGGGWALKDLGSEYGTIVNGARVRSTRLAHGDRIVVGSMRLEVTDGRAAEPAAERPAALTPEPAAAALPRVAGFRLERPLGRGGMGAVFLAVQESLDRRVALKILSPELARDADFVGRFVAEARAAAALHHPNVVTVFDVGRDGDQHWLAMEFMDRGNLEARVAREGPLPWTEVLAVLTDAARGLVFAEQKGIVHRDIKPANLMQAAAGGTKIADLGLATHLEADASGDRRILGTPHFIAPEQARGERVDARSDLYSLGATAYRLLTGRTPFEGETTRDILRGHFTEEPDPLRDLAPGVPAELAALVHRLLAKRPEDRYASAAILLSELERIQSGAPAAPAPAAGSRRGLAVAATVVVAAVAIGATALLRGGDDARDDAVVASGPEAAEPGTRAAEPEPPPVEPEPEPETLPDGPDVPLDDDRDLEMLELQAELAYRDLPPDLAADGRAARLRALATDFPGTTVATRAVTEAGELERAAADAIRVERERDALFGAAVAALREAGALDAEPFHPARALSGLLAAELDPEVAAAPGFAERRRDLFLEVGRRGRAGVADALARSAELEAAGDFEASAGALRAALAGLDLPDLPEELRFEDLVMLKMEAREVRRRLDRIDDRHATFDWEAARDDTGRLARALGGRAGFERELTDFDFAAAAARLAGVDARSPGGRALVAAWTAEVEGAGRAVDAITAAWKEGRWRRRALPDPRPGRGGTVEVVGVDRDGLQVAAGSSAEALPWSELSARARSLHDLFHERLDRDWTAAERADVAALLRLAASLQAVAAAEEMLVPARNASFTAGEARDVTEGFAHARAWSTPGDAGDAGGAARARLDREEVAAGRLADALVAASDGRYAAATAGLEDLLDAYRDTLVVRLLSDGSGLVDAPPEPEEDAPDEAPADAAPDGDAAGAVPREDAGEGDDESGR